LRSSVVDETSARVEKAIGKGTSDIDLAKNIVEVEISKPLSQRDEQAKVRDIQHQFITLFRVCVWRDFLCWIPVAGETLIRTGSTR